MMQTLDSNTLVTIDQNHCPMIYYPIDNDDYESVNFYKHNGYTVKTISLNGKPYHFVLVPVTTQEQADYINKEFSFLQYQEVDNLLEQHE